MKKTQRIYVYEDLAYHEKVRQDLERARVACQRLLDTWNRLDIGIITDMDGLQIRTEQCFKQAVEALIPAPAKVGKFTMKREVQLEQLELPDPSELLRVAKETQRALYCSVPGLFLTDGKTVTLDEDIVNFYVRMNDISITEPDKISLMEKLRTWLDLTNELNILLNQEIFNSASPISNRFFFNKCEFIDTDMRGENGKLAFLPEALKHWLQC